MRVHGFLCATLVSGQMIEQGLFRAKQFQTGETRKQNIRWNVSGEVIDYVDKGVGR